MGKKIVVSFPGGRGYEIPLLYFLAKVYEDKGYEKFLISHPGYRDYEYSELLLNAEKKIKQIDFDDYEDIVFVAKSIGTVIACQLKEKYQIAAKLILLTPLSETMPHIVADNNIKLVALGDKDRYIEPTQVVERCKEADVLCYLEQDVGHRMEVMNDIKRNLQIIENVIEILG